MFFSRLKYAVFALMLIFVGQSIAETAPCIMTEQSPADVAAPMMQGMDHTVHDMTLADLADQANWDDCCDDGNCPMQSCISPVLSDSSSIQAANFVATVQPDFYQVSYLPPEYTSLFRPPISC